MDNRTADKLSRSWDHYSNFLKSKGLNLQRIAGNRDEAPFESKYMISNDSIRVIARSYKTLKVIKYLQLGIISHAELIKLSTWPFSRLP